MSRSRHYHPSAGPTLSPGTAKALIDTFSHEVASSSSESPDSLYSNGSPAFPDHPAFEFEEHDAEVQDQDAYDAMRENEDNGGDDGETASWASPAWGRWPQTSRGLNSPGWTPSPRGSIISLSLSPRGSLSADARRSSASLAKGKMRAEGERRDSNPSLLGFDLANQRRRSSTRSLNSSRRRSSVYSTGSNMDPLEDARLRDIASMELLRRRFSEVVEVTYDSESDGQSEADLHAVARARAAISQWSPDSEESEEESEIHTASYHPTPELKAAAVPAVLSNFPLASVARAQEIQTPSDTSLAASPTPFSAPRFSQPVHQGINTPPPPAAPSAILRGKSRPAVQRAATAWEVPFTAAGVPPGAALPRPTLGRSVSNPWFSAAPKAREAASVLEKRAAGSFPVARTTPLGISPLRASLRRQSVVSDGDSSRRESLADRRPSSANASIKHRQSTVSDNDEARRTSLAERRLSLVKESTFRRLSGETRRSSKSGPGSRKSSTATSLRKGSAAESLRRTSKDSRKSSVVSIGEYGYLAPQIVIDAPLPTPPVPSTAQMPSQPRLRVNAPPSIILPAYTFPPHVVDPSPSTPYTFPAMGGSSASNTPLYTPRFNPMDSFLGRTSSHSPTTPSASPMRPPLSPAIPTTDNDQTPHSSPRVSVMNRGRPVASSPEVHSFPFRQAPPSSPKSSPVIPQEAVPSSPTPNSPNDTSPRSRGPLRVVTPNRKPAPKMSIEELQLETMRDDQLRLEKDAAMVRNMDRRGATAGAGFEQAILRGAAGHRRTVSIEDLKVAVAARTGQQGQISDAGRKAVDERPIIRRQATMPAEFSRPPGEPLYQRQQDAVPSRSREATSIHPFQDKGKSKAAIGLFHPQGEQRLSKRTSVTFMDQKQQTASPNPSSPKAPQKPGMGRTSSFTRFFHSRSKSSSGSGSGTVGSPKALKSALRPSSMDVSTLAASQAQGSGATGDSPRSSPLVPSSAKYGLGLGSPRR